MKQIVLHPKKSQNFVSALLLFSSVNSFATTAITCGDLLIDDKPLHHEVLKYVEPNDSQLIEEINQEIALNYGGEIDPKSDLYRTLNEVFQKISAAAGIDSSKYTLHVLASKYEANAYASPGNHIWITRALIEGTYYTRVNVIDYHGSYIREEPNEAPWSGSIEAIPLVLAHELGHHVNGDLKSRLEEYRKTRRESVLGGNTSGYSWLSVYDHFLPKGRTHKQEVHADKFALKATEGAGFSTTEILGSNLRSNQRVGFTHPADSQRAWQMGVRSSRPTNKETELLNKLATFRHNPSRFDSLPPKQTQDAPTFATSWETVTRIPKLYLKAIESKDPQHLPTLREDFQKSLLDILRSNPSHSDLKVLLKKLQHLSYVSSDGPVLIRSSLRSRGAHNEPLNGKTKYTDELTKEFQETVKRINPEQDKEISFSPYSNLEESLARSLDRTFYSQYKNGSMTFAQYLESVLDLGIFEKKDSIESLLNHAKTPADVAEGYHFIIRLGGRRWLQIDKVKQFDLQATTASWIKTAYVGGSMYEEIQRGLYEGAHVRSFLKKGGFSDPKSITAVVNDYIQAFTRDNSPLYRSAEAWAVGDLVGIVGIFPEFIEKPSDLKAILDKAGRDYFQGKPKAKFGTPRNPFAFQFQKIAKEIKFYRNQLDESLIFSLGLHVSEGDESRLGSIKYSKDLSKRYFSAKGGSPEEEAVIKEMIAELDAVRSKAPQSMRDSFILERHYMGMHPMKTFEKRLALLKALIETAPTQDHQTIFSKIGKLIKKYYVKDEYTGEADKDYFENFYGTTYASFENHYSAALGWVYDAAKTFADFDSFLKEFNFEKAPIIKWQAEMSRHFLMPADPFESVSTLSDGITLIDQTFSKRNPYRWIVFEKLWGRLGFTLGNASLEKITGTILPDLNYYAKKSKKENGQKNAYMLKEFFDHVTPRAMEDRLRDYTGIGMEDFLLKVQSVEREIYESALEKGLISSEPAKKVAQVEAIFRVSAGAEVSHPALDQVRLEYMRTLDKNSAEYAKQREKLTDPTAKAEASAPFLDEALAAEDRPTHDRQRDLIRKYLPVGTERDRYLDKHLAKAAGLDKLEIDRYAKLYSDHPQSEIQKLGTLKSVELDKLRSLKPEEKFQFVLFYLTRGNREFLNKGVDKQDQGVFLRTGNYVFERHPEEQSAFLTELFMGDRSLLENKALEKQLIDLVLLGGEGRLPSKNQTILTAIFESLYYSLDHWDRGQLLSELIVESQSKHRVSAYISPKHSPARAVRILRLFKGFGPKTAQILRSHKAILGDSAEAQRYRDAFTEFEEKAQTVDLREAIKAIEKSFGKSFDTYFKSIDGILGAGSIKKVLLATLNDGTAVAVKYIDHDFAHKVDHSLKILRGTIERLELRRNQFPNLPILESILEAIESDIKKEIDLEKEHKIYTLLRNKINKRQQKTRTIRVKLPFIQKELGLPLTDGMVIVEEAFKPISVENKLDLQNAGIDRNEAIHLHISEQLEELLIDGFFDYDSRPANWTPIKTSNGLELGYFDKAQGIFLKKTELDGLVKMLMGLHQKDQSLFEQGFRKFENQTKLPKDLSNAVSKALAENDPYSAIQSIIFSLENQGYPMSKSYSLKLSMWLRQLDRHIQMLPSFDLIGELTRVMMLQRGSKALTTKLN